MMNDDREVRHVERLDNHKWRAMGKTFKRQGQARNYIIRKGFKPGRMIYW
jgi:hypothetical protein